MDEANDSKEYKEHTDCRPACCRPTPRCKSEQEQTNSNAKPEADFHSSYDNTQLDE